MSATGSHTVPLVQVAVPGLQRSAASSQVSMPLQLTPSLHERAAAFPQLAAASQVSPVVQ
jgi:hypothetical protein